jgi:hypothetical protein
MKLGPLPAVSEADEVNKENFSKLFGFSREFLAAALADLPPMEGEEEEETSEPVEDS